MPQPSGDLLDLAARVAARAGPGEEVEAYVARGLSTRVRAYEGEVESLTSAESMGVGVRVVTGQRVGFAHAGSLEDDVVAETLGEARDNAAFGEVDPHAGLAAPDGVAPADLDLWRDPLTTLPTERKVDVALELEAATVGADPRIVGVRSAVYGDGSGEAAIATSTGVQAWSAATSCHVAVSALARDGDDTQIAGAIDAGRDLDEVDPERTAADAVERATRLIGARQPPTQSVAIVLEPRLAASVIGIVGGMATGEAVLKGRSPFADRVGETIASPLVDLVEDPTDGRSLGAGPYDGEGLACRRTPLIESGVLRGFLHNSYTGRRSGAGSTGSAARGYGSTPGVGCRALAVAPGSGSLDELVAGVDQGLLVQSMTGLHSGVNPVSGDFSVGVDGLMVRDGRVAEPVREATIASTLQRMLLDVRAVGDDLEWLPGGTAAATLVIDGVALSGA